jgi:MFS transporter, DHA1 family, inner membrane transport protein
MNAKERTLLFLLACINFTHILDFMIMMPLGNYLMPYFRISPKLFTVLVSSYAISAALSSFFSAFFVNAYDRKKVLLIGYIGFLIGTIACGFAPSYYLLLAARIFAGIFGGLIGAQVISIVSDAFSYERRGRAMGSIMSAFAVASILGVPLALYLANIFSWHAPFCLVGILGLVLVPMIIYFVPSMTGHIKNAKEQDRMYILTSVFDDKKQISALLFSGLVMFGHFLIIPFINPYMEFNNGYSKELTPLIYLVGGIASFIAAAILGRLSDKKGKLRTFIVCVLLALPMIYGITHIPKVPYVWVLSLFAVWFVVATGRGVTSQAMISNVVKPEFRGSFQSFNSSMQQLGTGLASIVTGFIVTKDPTGKILHYDWAGYLSMIVLFSTVFIAQRVFKSFETLSPQIKDITTSTALEEVKPAS